MQSCSCAVLAEWSAIRLVAHLMAFGATRIVTSNAPYTEVRRITAITRHTAFSSDRMYTKINHPYRYACVGGTYNNLRFDAAKVYDSAAKLKAYFHITSSTDEKGVLNNRSVVYYIPEENHAVHEYNLIWKLNGG